MKLAIVIVGGYNSLWPAYLKMARTLEDISGLQAIGVPLMPWHWWAANQAENAGNILHRLYETVVWARRRLQADRFILVGHSAGGLIERLYLHDGPVWGRTYAAAEQVAAVITLGTPHCSARGTRTGWYLADEANRAAPGTPFAGQVRYLAVAGRFLPGAERGSYQQRRAYRNYRFFGATDGAWGDGVVPIECAKLAGAPALVLEGVAHSPKYGANWFGGSKTIIRRWWPQRMLDAT